jgi:hypothetical protein
MRGAMRPSMRQLAVLVLLVGVAQGLPVLCATPDSLCVVGAAQELLGTGARVRRVIPIPEAYRPSGRAGFLVDVVESSRDTVTTQVVVEFMDNSWRARTHECELTFDRSGSTRAVRLDTPIDIDFACKILKSVRPQLRADERITAIFSFADIFANNGEAGKMVLLECNMNGKFAVRTTRSGTVDGRIFIVQARGDSCVTESVGNLYH